jgi:molybdenum cofactor cytidylyltransferase
MIAALVLAAGLSRRMGRPKLLLELEGKTLLRWAVDGVVRHVDETVVVAGPDDAAIRATLAGLPVRFVTNPDPARGQGASIAVGVAGLSPGTGAVLIVLGDQPRLHRDVVPALRAAADRSGLPIVAPVYRGVQGNPVLFAASVFGELAALGEDAGARAVVLRDPTRVECVPFDLPMPADVDTPTDFAKVTGTQSDTL